MDKPCSSWQVGMGWDLVKCKPCVNKCPNYLNTEYAHNQTKLAKARKIREEIWQLFEPQIVRLWGITEIGFKRAITKIIKKRL